MALVCSLSVLLCMRCAIYYSLTSCMVVNCIEQCTSDPVNVIILQYCILYVCRCADSQVTWDDHLQIAFIQSSSYSMSVPKSACVKAVALNGPTKYPAPSLGVEDTID